MKQHIFNALLILFSCSATFSVADHREDTCESRDPYDLLYTPWRTLSCPMFPFVKGEWKKNCPFCNQFAADEDQKNYIVKRLEHNVIIMNLHPYSAGHLMIIPYQHAATLDRLSAAARIELIETLSKAMPLLQSAVHCHGFNIGMNIGAGKGTGGSIPDHLHMQIVPRWEGDNNFMTVIAQTRLMACNMSELYATLIKAFEHFSP